MSVVSKLSPSFHLPPIGGSLKRFANRHWALLAFPVLLLSALVLVGQLFSSESTLFAVSEVIVFSASGLWSLVICLLSPKLLWSDRLVRLWAWSQLPLFAVWIATESARPWWAQLAIAAPLLVLLIQTQRRR
ncbi:hypothetical protein ACFSJ3_14895 [Corallincola platygyrae]|uniref:Uncharacterized protein n=1 Tax=Corallincola platygyrae TaxID=1193278 RepID=A0ABW4XP12_9GAMM